MQSTQVPRASDLQAIAHTLYFENKDGLLNLFEVRRTRREVRQIEVRDYVYSSLIRLTPATHYHNALISGAKGLLARGLGRDGFNRYGGLPASWGERERLCRRLLREISERYHTADSLRGVPGFWKDAHGFHLWKETDYPAPRLLMRGDGREPA